MNRKYPDHPIVGVGAVIFQGDQVLLIQRGKEPGFGQWSIPGGAVMTGETLKEAVIREILEETHLEVEVLSLIKVLDRIFREPDGRVSYHYVLIDFLCRVKEGKLQSDSDALDARFVSLADLASYEMASITVEVIQRADRLRKATPPGLPCRKGAYPMDKDPFVFFRKRTIVFWVPLVVIAAGLLTALISPWGEREEPKGGIPLQVLSHIQQERAQAQKDHEDFLKTQAGKIWQKYPYWDRELCQRIAAGEVSPGMSKDQVREAVGSPARVIQQEREGAITEEWVVEGKEKLILKFKNNLLVSLEKK